jgi:hypothetical protein
MFQHASQGKRGLLIYVYIPLKARIWEVAMELLAILQSLETVGSSTLVLVL